MLDVALHMVRDNKNKLDTTAIIQGGEGSAKSHFAATLGKVLAEISREELGDNGLEPVFDLERDIIYKDDVEKFRECLYSEEPYRVIIPDEVHNFLYALDHTKGEVKGTAKEFKNRRYKRQYWLCCSPTLYDLHKYFREYRFRWNFVVYYVERGWELERGYAHIYRLGEWVKDGFRETNWRYYGTMMNVEKLPDPIEAIYDHKKWEADQIARTVA